MFLPSAYITTKFPYKPTKCKKKNKLIKIDKIKGTV